MGNVFEPPGLSEFVHKRKDGSAVLSSLIVMLNPSKYGLERWSYVLQRISGVVVSFYFIAHVLETGNFFGGITVWGPISYETAKQSYEAVKAFLKDPLFDAGLAVIGLLVAFHSFNGIRLILAHFGLALKRPSRPEPPYWPSSFSNLQRALFWLSIGLAVFALVYTLDSLMGVFRS
jgi:succinate dehydrogenase / fumarate reductase cytochrome b subunit